MNFIKLFLSLVLFSTIQMNEVRAFESSGSNECENVVMSENSGKLYLERTKRHLTFPNASLFQVNFGVGVPVPLKYKKININLIFQANFVLPWNLTQFPEEVLFGPLTSTARRKRETISDINMNGAGKSDDVDDKDEIITNDVDDNTMNRMEKDKSEETKGINDNEKRDTSHSSEKEISNVMTMNNYEEGGNYLRIFDIYKVLEEHFERYGYNGSDCILKTVCQLGAEPLHTNYEDDVLHDIMQLLMRPAHIMNIETPESPRRTPEDPVIQRYIDAQISGEQNQDCNVLYPYCLLSPADFFTKTFHRNIYGT